MDLDNKIRAEISKPEALLLLSDDEVNMMKKYLKSYQSI